MAALLRSRRLLSTLASETELRFPTAAARRSGGALAASSERRGVQWVFLGCPGVGKGTYASRLSSLLSVPHIATGDLVRDELASSGPLSHQDLFTTYEPSVEKITMENKTQVEVKEGTVVLKLNLEKLLTLKNVKHMLAATKNLFSGSLLYNTGVRMNINAGQMLSEIVNQGKLVSDEIIINLLSKRLANGEAKGESGFLLDGFPRTIRQAEILEGVTDIDLVINLKLQENVLLEKCLGRRICSQCGGNFNIASINVKGENGKPDIVMAPLPPPEKCASKLITRADDTEEVVKERLRIYNSMSQPVEEFYRSRGKLLEFDLPGGIPESWPKLLQALNLDEHHEDEKMSVAA